MFRNGRYGTGVEGILEPGVPPLGTEAKDGVGVSVMGAASIGGGPPSFVSATNRDFSNSSLSFSKIVVFVVSASSPVMMPPYGTFSSSLSTSTVLRLLLDSRRRIRIGGGVGSGSDSDPSRTDSLRFRPCLSFIRGVGASNDSTGMTDLRGLPKGRFINVAVGRTAVIDSLES